MKSKLNLCEKRKERKNEKDITEVRVQCDCGGEILEITYWNKDEPRIFHNNVSLIYRYEYLVEIKTSY